MADRALLRLLLKGVRAFVEVVDAGLADLPAEPSSPTETPALAPPALAPPALPPPSRAEQPRRRQTRAPYIPPDTGPVDAVTQARAEEALRRAGVVVMPGVGGQNGRR